MAAIKAAQPFAPKWKNAFAGAQSLYLSTSDFVSSREFTYDLTFADFPVIRHVVGASPGRDGVYFQAKTVRVEK